MPRTSRRSRRSGFTLIELVVGLTLLALLAGAATPLATQQIRGHRIRVTQERMENILFGMVGDPARGGHGYLGDLGSLPVRLEDLNALGTHPPFSIDPRDGVGTGFDGPYAPLLGAPGTPFIDAWGTPFRYVGAPQLFSAGSDRQFDTPDDLTYPDVPPGTLGHVSIAVTGVPNNNMPPCILGEDEVDVFISSSTMGTRSEVQVSGPIGTGGPFVASSLHRGLHGVRVEGNGIFAGVETRNVVELHGGAAYLQLTLVQQAGALPACQTVAVSHSSFPDNAARTRSQT